MTSNIAQLEKITLGVDTETNRLRKEWFLKEKREPQILLEEMDGSNTFRPIPAPLIIDMIKDFDDRVEIHVPNFCGGETRITVFKDLLIPSKV